MLRTARGLSVLAVAATALLADSAAAQVEEITVTSRRRAERLQDVPDAISAFSAQQIEDRGIEGVRDFARQVPNLDFRTPQQQGTAFITIRGVGMERFQDPSVAFLIDGVQLTSSYQLAQELFDIERIEVLKGPQGALYGRNAIGGAVNIVTRQPDDTLHGQGSVEWGEGNLRKMTLSAQGPIAPGKAWFSVGGTWSKFDGLIDNVYLNKKVDYDDRKTGRAKLLFEPVEGLRIDVRASSEFAKPGAAYYVPLVDGHANDTSSPVVSNVRGSNTRRLHDYSLKVDWTGRYGTLTSTTSYLSTDDKFYEDLDYSPLPNPIPAQYNHPDAQLAFPFGPGGALITVPVEAFQRVTVHSWSQELRFTSPSEQRLRYQFGGFLSTIRQYTQTDAFFFLFGPTGPLELDLNSNNRQDAVWALFGQANYDLMPGLELTVAARYDHQDKKQTNILENIPREVRFSNFQPKASLSYKWTPEVMTYVTVAKGFRGGGFNNSDFAGRVYKSETLMNYEVGAKTTLFDRRLTLNPSAFFVTYDNRQEYVLDLTSGSQVLFNVPKTELYGFELEASARPVQGLQIDLGIGYLHSRITDLGSSFRFPGVVVGNKVPYVPDFTANLGVQYTMPVGPVSLTGRVDVSHKSGLYWALDNRDKQDAVELVDLRLIAEFQNGLQLVAYGRNVFDKRYADEVVIGEFSGLFTAQGKPFDARVLARPRQLGVMARMKF
jgi:iron complex outermembrane recepter protein